MKTAREKNKVGERIEKWLQRKTSHHSPGASHPREIKYGGDLHVSQI